jgi:hypothetical protein
LAVLRDNPTDDEKKYFEGVIAAVSPRRSIKWNIIDRNDPYVTMTEEGSDKRVMGLKISTIGMEAYKMIEGIFDQCKTDITDPDTGIDIKINKGKNATRTVYTAQACVDGLSLLVTPFTEEERALIPHDLKVVCGKQGDIGRYVDALHEDLKNLLNEAAVLDTPVDEVAAGHVEEEEPVEEVAAAPVAPARPAAPVAPRAPVRPAAPVAAAKPVVPARPVAPARPAVPVAATKPAAPARPVAPVVRNPSVPARPVAPAAAAAPARPVAPARPTAPARPIAPVRPVRQDAVEEAIAEGEGLEESAEDQSQKKR